MRRTIRGIAGVGLLGLTLMPACFTGKAANVGAEDPDGGSGAGDGDTGGASTGGASTGGASSGGAGTGGASSGGASSGGAGTGGASGSSGGALCVPGDERPRGDGCNTCGCSEVGWTCTSNVCPCEPGTLVVAPDGCNACGCNEDGTVGPCTEKACDVCITSPTFEGCVHEPRFAHVPGSGTCCFYADACDAPAAWQQFTSFDECMDFEPGCPPGTADCDGEMLNGCETSVSFDASNCGSCGNQCETPAHAFAVCDQGNCGFSCDDGWLDCNDSRDDGCEYSGTACLE